MRKLILFLAGSAIVSIGACHKKANNHVKDNLVGRWRATENARDDNGNGKLDEGESFPDRLYAENNLVFESNGEVNLINNNMINGRKQWELMFGDTYLRIIEPAYSTDYHIDKITPSELVLKDTSGRHTSWYLFAKVK